MKRWEYIHVIKGQRTMQGTEWNVCDGFGNERIIVSRRFALMLDTLGDEGWEMAGGSHGQFVFKREIMEG